MRNTKLKQTYTQKKSNTNLEHRSYSQKRMKVMYFLILFLICNVSSHTKQKRKVSPALRLKKWLFRSLDKNSSSQWSLQQELHQASTVTAGVKNAPDFMESRSGLKRSWVMQHRQMSPSLPL